MFTNPWFFYVFSSNPERLQGMLQMASMLRDAGGPQGANPFGGFGNTRTTFPAPGTPSTGNTTSTTTSPAASDQPAQPRTAAANPFAAFFPPAAGGAAPAAGLNPFGMDPAVMQQILGMSLAGGGAGGGFGVPAASADTRSPEERFQVQLQVGLL